MDKQRDLDAVFYKLARSLRYYAEYYKSSSERSVLFGESNRLGEYERGQSHAYQDAYKRLTETCRANGIRLKPDKILPNTPIDELPLSTRLFNCLWRAGINTVGDITQLSESNLARIRGLGVTALRELKEFMAEYGLTFAPGDGPGALGASGATGDDFTSIVAAMGQRFRAAREARGGTVESVAQEAGLEPKRVEKLESGDVVGLDLTALSNLAAAVGLKLKITVETPDTLKETSGEN